MKKADFVFGLLFTALFAPFFLSQEVFDFYSYFNATCPFLISFVKFAVLATLGEVIGLRIRKGVYYQHGFGIFPRALVWGILGISIKAAFVIFGEGGPQILAILGFRFDTPYPSHILNLEFLENPTWLHFFSAFSVSLTLNLFFAPVFMTVHKITDEHIHRTGGNLKRFFTVPDTVNIITQLNWKVHWNFVLKKTIPLFWIPAQTINFLLPGEIRILVAAILGIVLGIILSVASLKEN